MAGLSKADALLLEQVQRGDERAWTDVVERFQGRLVAFARRRVNDEAQAEDLVQDTFIACLRGLQQFRGEAGLETFLFTILRRKIIDHYRGRKRDLCSLQQTVPGRTDEDGAPIEAALADPTTGASWHARDLERRSAQARALTAALTAEIGRYKEALDFQGLKLLELMFYCGASSPDIARLMDMPQATVRTFRHRCLGRIRDHITAATGGEPLVVDAAAWRTEEQAESMLRAVWQSGRLSCPKRSTLGAYHLETLEPDWAAYVRFHLDELGCHFCQANLEDLRTETARSEDQRFVERLMQSTVGFLHRPPRN